MLTDDELRKSINETGPQFRKYDNYKMSITANDDSIETPPILINGWEDLNPPSVLLHNIKKLRMAEPTPIQRLACNVIRKTYATG